MGLRIFQVDAFADKMFSGNPAAVCLLEKPMPEAWMQSLAEEMNLSETAFLLKQGGHFQLRWFTPRVEVPLCGHATLASAHVLWRTGSLGRQERADFLTSSGMLSASLLEDGRIEMDFPTQAMEPSPLPQELEQALGARLLGGARRGMKFLAEVENEDVLRGLKPDFALLARIPNQGIIATCASSLPDFDFISRYFAGYAGIPEDPVTGSAHCSLAPFWGQRLGKTRMSGFQASARGGVVGVRLEGERTFLSGKAATVLHGELEA